MARWNANMAPPPGASRAELRAKLLAEGWQPGPYCDHGPFYAGDAETAAEGTCDHCGRRGLQAEPYFRETAAGLEYNALEVCPRCGWAMEM